MTNDVTTTGASVSLATDDMLRKMSAKSHATDFKASDLLVPYLTIIQSMSPYVKRSDPQYIEGAQEGDIIDTLTLKLRASVPIILCKYEMNYTTWSPNRGPLVKQWGPDPSGYDAATGDYGTRVDAEGNDIVPTAVYYALIVNDDGSAMPVKWSLGGTQFKKSRRINSLIEMLELNDPDTGPFTPPMYARIYNLSTVPESKEQYRWMGWKIEPGPLTLAIPRGESLFIRAEKFREACERGQVRDATPEARPDAGVAGSDSAPPRGATHPNDDIPF